MHYFNWVDYFIVGILIFSTLISFFRGFLKEAISLIIWITAVWLAIKFSPWVQTNVVTWVQISAWRYPISFILIFLSVLLIGSLFNTFIHTVIRRAGFAYTDRMLGIFFGVVRGIFVVSILLIFVKTESGIKPEALLNSRLTPHFTPVVTWLHGILPKEMKNFSKWFLSNTNMPQGNN